MKAMLKDEHPRDDGVPDKPQDPAQQGGAAHHPGGPKDPAAFIHGVRTGGRVE